MKLHPEVEKAMDAERRRCAGVCRDASCSTCIALIVEAAVAAQRKVDTEKCREVKGPPGADEYERGYDAGCDDCARAIQRGEP